MKDAELEVTRREEASKVDCRGGLSKAREEQQNSLTQVWRGEHGCKISIVALNPCTTILAPDSSIS